MSRNLVLAVIFVFREVDILHAVKIFNNYNEVRQKYTNHLGHIITKIIANKLSKWELVRMLHCLYCQLRDVANYGVDWVDELDSCVFVLPKRIVDHEYTPVEDVGKDDVEGIPEVFCHCVYYLIIKGIK